jgi:hypothetical protein
MKKKCQYPKCKENAIVELQGKSLCSSHFSTELEKTLKQINKSFAQFLRAKEEKNG